MPTAGGCADPHSLGYVYIIGFDEPNLVKIGSATCVGSRLAGLQSGNPYRLRLHYAVSIYEGNRIAIERGAHAIAKDCCVLNEWFRLAPADALEIVIKAARNKKAKFGAYALAYEATRLPPIDKEAEEVERRRRLRIKLGMDD